MFMDCNDDAYYTFWYWINERHRIYIKRHLVGAPKPWSDDPIFQQWKFCNVFRNLDRQSKWLSAAVLEQEIPDELMLFNIYAFRAFNWYKTFYELTAEDATWIKEWDIDVIQNTLAILASEGQLTSGAYMLRGRQGMPKYESIAMTLDEIWNRKDVMAKEILGYQDRQRPLQEVYEYLIEQKFWGWGPFTTYQIVLDLIHTDFLVGADDINTWCEFGPGAERGIKLIYPEAKPKDYLPLTRQLLERQSMHLEDHMPIMTLQDIEFSLCELSKYMRIKNGGKSKEKFNGSPD